MRFSNPRQSSDLFNGRVVLVVDDEPSNIQLLTRMLESFGGFTVHSTTDPREAIHLFAKTHLDLVILDLHMPHLDGYQVMDRLLQIVPEDRFLPIIVITADVSPETRWKVLGAGAFWILIKPLDTMEMEMLVVRALTFAGTYSSKLGNPGT